MLRLDLLPPARLVCSCLSRSSVPEAPAEAAMEVKANPALRAVPVIAVTSYALSGDETKALAAGADAYVSKPFSPRALLAKVREFLG